MKIIKKVGFILVIVLLIVIYITNKDSFCKRRRKTDV